jgi:Domain of unknown function (DUF4268)
LAQPSHIRKPEVFRELWRIGDSPAAPKFNIVSKPNSWSMQTSAGRKAIDDGAQSETRQMQLEYWQAYETALAASKTKVKARAASGSSWIAHAIGKSGFSLNTTMNTFKDWIKVEIYLSGKRAKANFAMLLGHKAEIESAVGSKLDWQEMPEGIECRICLFRANSDPFNKSDWPAQHAWLVQMTNAFYEAFKPFIGALNDQGQDGEVMV